MKTLHEGAHAEAKADVADETLRRCESLQANSLLFLTVNYFNNSSVSLKTSGAILSRSFFNVRI